MKILSIKPITTKNGNPKVLIQTASVDVWLSIKQYQSKGCSNVLDNYVGGDVEVDYFAKGEKLFNGEMCTESGKILRDFVISANPVVLANAFAIEASMKMQDMSDKSALFARNRANPVVVAEPAKLAE